MQDASSYALDSTLHGPGS